MNKTLQENTKGNASSIPNTARNTKSRYTRIKRRRSITLLLLLTIAVTVIAGATFVYGASIASEQVFEANKTHVVNVKKETLEKQSLQSMGTTIVSRGVQRVKTIKEGFIYSDKIKMPKEHQEYLYNLCKYYELDYVKTLSVIKHESQFNPSAFSETNDYGYMQINKGNHSSLSEILGTKNAPLDPYINMIWGTYILNEAYDIWADAGITGDKLDAYAWSTYNKGLGGFKKTGQAVNYVSKVRDEYEGIAPFYN